MAKKDDPILKKIAYDGINEAVVSPGEFLTQPGKTIEDYIDGLLDADFDISMMNSKDIKKLREYLRLAVDESIKNT
ncbi:MAG: hypothetical protein ACYC3H_08385 [Bellilinea sp.]